MSFLDPGRIPLPKQTGGPHSGRRRPDYEDWTEEDEELPVPRPVSPKRAKAIFEEGCEAYLDGVHIKANPYGIPPDRNTDADHWEAGWNDEAARDEGFDTTVNFT